MIERPRAFFDRVLALAVFLCLYPYLLLPFSVTDVLRTSTVTSSADSGSIASVALNSAQGIQLTYSLGTGNYAIATADFTSQNLTASGGNSLRFRYKATGNQNTLEVKFTDGDSTDTSRSDKLDFKFLTTPDGQWRTVNLVFSTFTTFNDGSSAFDLAKVARMAFAVTQDNSSRGSGSVYLDKIELTKST